MPELLRARMLSLYSYSWIGIAPLGGLLAGWLSDRGGPALVFGIIGAAIATLATMSALGRQGQMTGENFTLQLSDPISGGELTAVGNGEKGMSGR
jgi:MFS family permease